MTVRVLLADDQALLRATFRLLLEAEPDIEVVGEAANGAEAVDRARSTRADVVLMDIRMPGVDGIEATARITRDEDLAGVRVLVLTTFETDEFVVGALRAGASGFLSKGADPADLLNAIRVVAAGESLLSPTATTALISRFLSQPDPHSPPDPHHAPDADGASGTHSSPDDHLPTSPHRSPSTGLPPGAHSSAGVRLASEISDLSGLTGREREITALVGAGLSNQEIADRLFISPATAKTHVNRAMMKTASRDRAQLVIFAYEHGLAGRD